MDNYLNNILNFPEGRTLEFKRDISSLKPILKTLVAFANTAGGTLLIGKDDNGNLVGVNDILQAEERLANAISDSIFPPLMPEIDSISFQEKSLLLIRVAHWRGPFYLKSQGPEEGVYIRLGSTNRLAGPDLLAEMKRSFSNISFDQLACPEIGIEGLDMKKINDSFSILGRKVDQNKLETLGVLVPYSGKLVCSNGGVILFGKKELRDIYFPNSTVRCARFQGIEKVNFIDQYDTEGSIIDAMKEVPNFIKRNSRIAAKIEKIHREDIPEYSSIAIREVLTNALVHADYSLKGMSARVMIFSNRLEIESPGMLPFGYTFNDFISGVSHIRNRVIARVFRELHLMEEWGTGYKRITETSKMTGYSYPTWEEIGTTIKVTFSPHIATLDEIRDPPKKESEKLPQRQEKILSLCLKKGPLTAKAIYLEMGSGNSERTLRKDLLTLKKLHLIQTIGKGPNSLWSAI
jgi:ATP-dependent DNA helicase RecG